MEVILFRHGIAEPGRDDLPDAERALTSQGLDRTRLAAQGLARVVDRPRAVLSSPKRRAHQTACLLAEVFDLPVETCDLLGEEDVDAIVRLLHDRGEDALMLVGHEPTFSLLAASMLGVAYGRGEVDVKKAAAVVLDAPLHERDHAGPAVLRMLLPPRVLRRLAGDA